MSACPRPENLVSEDATVRGLVALRDGVRFGNDRFRGCFGSDRVSHRAHFGNDRAHVGAPGGHATLVGCGPGDADLMTLRALRAIECADVLLFDALIDPAILDFARPDARRIDVGKRCGRHAMQQVAINALIVRLAQAGAHVVRLKGGDPFVFGRGGEELQSLRAAGVPVTIVPGVTAACAAAASLQLPLTHRGVAHSVHFVTGHAADGALPAHDWTALVRSGGTIAAYMAGRTLAEMAARLMEAGMAAATPAVAVENASRENERRLFGTIGQLPGALAGAGFTGPTMVLIGAAVGLAEEVAISEQLAQGRLVASYV